MSEHHDTPTTSWAAPRLVALGAAQASKDGTARDSAENDTYYPASPV